MHYLTFILLCLSIASTWLHRWPQTWLVLAFASLASAIYSEILPPIALIFVGALFFLCIIYSKRLYLSTKLQIPQPKFLFGSAIVIVGFLMATHVLPGFSRTYFSIDLIIAESLQLSKLSFNYGKGLAGLLLLVYCVRQINNNSQWKSITAPIFRNTAITASVVFSLAIWLGVVAIDVKFHWLFILWALNNLFFTCVAEEVLFRGLLQHHCANWLNRFHRHGNYIAIILVSSLFLLVHFKGGIEYALLAFVASLGYGWVYYKTGKIEASILMHFLVNTIHIIFFTYPALKVE